MTDRLVSREEPAVPKNTFRQITDEKRERVLLQAACLFADRGYEQTDMAELARRAGVSKGSLYTYFESKEDLFIYVCRDGLERSRQAVYGGIKPDWDIYRQVEHIFQKGAAFVLAHPEYLILYLGVSSPGMERFARKISVEVEKYTADHLKRLLRRAKAESLVRPDLEVNSAAFFINSIYIIYLASLVSPHYQLRAKEYLGIRGEITPQSMARQRKKIIADIHSFLGRSNGRAPRSRKNATKT